MITQQRRGLEGSEAVGSKKSIFSAFVILCCAVLIELVIIICLANAPKEVQVKEVTKEVEVPVVVEVIKEVEIIKEIPVEILVEVPIEIEPTYVISSEEREMLARLVFLEANTESLECQKAIVSAIINRWQYGHWGDTLEDVVYAQDQFTPSGDIWKTTPNETNYEAVDTVIRDGITIPEYVMYFRLDWGFSNVWDEYVEYDKIDRTCFGYFTKDVQ